MGCGCKKKTGINKVIEDTVIKKDTNIILRLLLFMLVSSVSVIIYPFVFVILFKHIVLGSDIDMTSMFKKILKKNDDIQDEPDEEINPDDYEYISVDEIKKSDE